jgi:hypothetical protein
MQILPVVPVLIILVLAISAGCTAPPPAATESKATSVPAVLPTTENIAVSLPVSDMTLQLSDLPSGYIIRDRSVMISPEITQIARELGWRQGYFVTFDRTDRMKSDQTRIRQAISIFPPDAMKTVFQIEKDELLHGGNPATPTFEIPFPSTGNRSIATRINGMPSEGQVTYTVIFTKKNVFERITMSGTSTDYEILKDVVNKAAAKVR